MTCKKCGLPEQLSFQGYCAPCSAEVNNRGRRLATKLTPSFMLRQLKDSEFPITEEDLVRVFNEYKRGEWVFTEEP